MIGPVLLKKGISVLKRFEPEVDQAVTGRQMQDMDRRAIEEIGIPGLVLMDNAGRGVSETVKIFPRAKKILILAGKGNNGGDGLVAARYLANDGYQVQVVLFAAPGQMKSDPAICYKIIQKMQIPCRIFTDSLMPVWFQNCLGAQDLVIDALFGVGLDKPLQEPYLSVLTFLNQSRKTTIAVDLPSGLHADTGKVMGVAVKAALTAALGLVKKGLIINEGPSCSGKIYLVDLGIPRAILGGSACA